MSYHSYTFYSFEDYARWRDEQVCEGCGKPFKGDTGRWATETECWECFTKRGGPAYFEPATEMGEPLSLPDWIADLAQEGMAEEICSVLRAAEKLDATISRDLVKDLHEALAALKARVKA